MKTALTTATLACLAAIAAMAQPRGGPQAQSPAQPPANAQPAAPNINLIIEQLQRAVLSTNGDLGKLRIEKWKTDSTQKQQFQKMADSIQRNVTYAVPGLINDVETSHGSVAATFKLYHNMTIVYEYLSSLTDAAGALGKREEYEPLARDAAALDAARQNLSTYIEKTASQLESRRQAPAPVNAAPAESADEANQKLPEGVHIVTEKNGVRRIVVDREHKQKPARHTKKKTSETSKASKAAKTTKASPSPSPSPK